MTAIEKNVEGSGRGLFSYYPEKYFEIIQKTLRYVSQNILLPDCLRIIFLLYGSQTRCHCNTSLDSSLRRICEVTDTASLNQQYVNVLTLSRHMIR